MEEFKIEGYDFTFRVRKMNAIEVLAFRSQMGFDGVEKVKEVFETMLENMEVKCGDEWLPVKTKGMDVFYPKIVETDVILVQSLVEHFTNFLKPVFPKSNASIQ